MYSLTPNGRKNKTKMNIVLDTVRSTLEKDKT